MNKDQRIASLAMKANRLIAKLADLESKKTKNVWITETGNYIQVVNPEIFDKQITAIKEEIDQTLKLIDEERDGETKM